MKDNRQPPRLIDKYSGILEVLAERGQATAADIAEILGEPRSSVHRLLGQLEAVGWVERSRARGQWRLGLDLFRLGTKAVEGRDVRTQALPYMQELNERTEETVFLCIRRRLEAVCIERIEGRYVRSLALGLGGSLALHLGAAPRCLLAFSPVDVVDEWRESMQGRPFELRTPYSHPSVRAIEEELERVRQQGYSTSDQDVTIGIGAVGVPIFGVNGELAASLSISGVQGVVPGSPTVIDALLEAGRAISHELGFRPEAQPAELPPPG